MASSTTRQTLDEAYPGLSSEDAIAGAADDGRSINKYADPIEGARFGLTAEEADEVAASDPSLLWVEECDDDDDDDDEDAPHCESGTVTGNRCGGAPTERLHVSPSQVVPRQPGRRADDHGGPDHRHDHDPRRVSSLSLE